ncbi:MAG: AmmeMemoRadiSam system protein B [Candidatus Micrarchaeia archaeon]
MPRHPAVAGSFYPAEKAELSRMLAALFKQVRFGGQSPGFANAKAFVAPHAGYEYSGYVAAYTYAALQQLSERTRIDAFVIIGPDHVGAGDFVTVSLEDWETPLGIARNDKELSREIANIGKFSTGEDAIAEEHSIEVQVPFLQYLFPDAACSFICMSDQSISASKQVSSAVLSASQKQGKSVVVIASSDFDHYEPASVAESKDMPAIRAAEALDYNLFNRLLAEADDTACGYGAITSAMLFAKAKGATRGVLLKYGNSGNATGDFSSVVAYASLAFV